LEHGKDGKAKMDVRGAVADAIDREAQDKAHEQDFIEQNLSPPIQPFDFSQYVKFAEDPDVYSLALTWNRKTGNAIFGHNAPSEADMIGNLLPIILRAVALRVAPKEIMALNLEAAAEAQNEALERHNDPASKLITPNSGIVAPGAGGIIRAG
jgi:hypothetical protein